VGGNYDLGGVIDEVAAFAQDFFGVVDSRVGLSYFGFRGLAYAVCCGTTLSTLGVGDCTGIAGSIFKLSVGFALLVALDSVFVACGVVL